MSPKPYERQLHHPDHPRRLFHRPVRIPAHHYRLTPDKAERLADMLDTALDEAENKRERNQP